MIQVTRLNGKEYFLNPHQIEAIEEVPDTTILLLSGKRVVVQENSKEVIERIIAYRKTIGCFSNEE